MAPEGLRKSKRPSPLAVILGSVGSDALLRSLEAQEFDAARPQVTIYSRRSARLRSLAMRCAADGSDDAVAVQELLALAGRRTVELRRAAASIRSEGLDGEDGTAHRADQLLRAAVTGVMPRPLTAEEALWFGRVRALIDAPRTEAFAYLVAAEPRLGLLEIEVQQATEGSGGAVGSAVDDDKLRNIVDDASDPLVRTHAAWSIARAHLVEIAGPPDPGEAAQPRGFPGWNIPD